jgi:hypothetical protein
MSERSANAHRLREDHHRSIESAQMRRIDVGAAETARWCLASLRSAFDDAVRLDGSVSYVASTLRRHVQQRAADADNELNTCATHLIVEHRRMRADLAPLVERAARIDDVIADLIAAGGVPSDLERIVMRLLLETLERKLQLVRNREIELTICHFWEDLGGSG